MRRLPLKWLQAAENGAAWVNPKEGGKGWESVRGGVAILAVAAFIVAGVLLLGMVAAFLEGMLRDRESSTVLVMLAALGLLVASMLGLAGFVSSLTSPRRAGLRGLVYGSIACLVVGTMVVLSPFPLADQFRALPVWNHQLLTLMMSLAGILLILVGTVMYFVYLGRVARSFGDASLAGLLLTYGCVTAVLVALNVTALIVFEFLYRTMGTHEQEVMLLCGLAAKGMALMIWLGFLLWKVRKRIPTTR